jgi:signal transduction histidine kinase
MTQGAGVPQSFAAVTRGRAGAVIATIAAVTAIAVAFGGFGTIAHPATPWIIAVETAAVGLLAIDAWLLSTRRAVATIGTAVVAAVSAAGMAALVLAFPDRLQAILGSTEPLAIPGAAWIALGWRGQDHRGRWILATPCIAACVMLVLLFDPIREPRCLQVCADAPAVLPPLLSARSTLAAAAGLTILSAVAFLVLAIRRGRAAAPMIVLASAGACVAAVTGSLVWRIVRWEAPPTEPAPTLLPVAGTLVLAVGVLGAVLVEARMRAAANRLAASLTDPPGSSPPPTHFAVPGEGRWIDADGAPVGDAERGLVLQDAGVPIARVTAGATEPADTVSELGAARLLALRNAQLAAVARARVAELRASRRRIVEIADTESGRIERDLHDGAQQRLVSSMLYLAVARRGEPGLDQLGRAETAIRRALDQLRSIAHGLAPEVLRIEGVWAAVEELAAGVSVPVELGLPSGRPADDAAGAALHFGIATVVELAVAASASRLRISCAEREGTLHAVVDVSGVSGEPVIGTEAADRIGALGGWLEATTTESELRVVMEVPCGS